MRKFQNLGLWVLVGATILLATTLVAGPAAAKTAHLTDARDSRANVDITSVTYRNGEARAGASVHLRDLQPTGRLVTMFGAPDSDVIYAATVWVKRDGTLGKRLELVTDASAAGGRDAVRGLTVGRGSSPGCVTAGGIRGLHRGDAKSRVHAPLDTAGRLGGGAAGGYSRVYRPCSGGKPWFVEYDGSTDTPVATGRVR